MLARVLFTYLSGEAAAAALAAEPRWGGRVTAARLDQVREHVQLPRAFALLKRLAGAAYCSER
jgi:hypothetical protein